MGRNGVTVDPHLAAAVAAHAAGQLTNVAATCRQHGITRATFYRYLTRYRADGVPGLLPRSRRPHTSPHAIPDTLVTMIVRARKDLADDGADAGPVSIGYWLRAAASDLDHPHHHDLLTALTTTTTTTTGGGELRPLPSRATIARVLARTGMATPTPAKRPRSAHRRFSAPAPNALWQMDGFRTPLADGREVTVIQIIDDYSRLDLACHVAISENGPDAWKAFTAAAASYGLPTRLLTDNGSAFSGARRGWMSDLDAGARALGVRPITSRVGHPQTNGKVERAHATTQQWLAARPVAADMAALQVLLQDYRGWYNHRRPHTAVHGQTPAVAYALASPAGPAEHPLPAPLMVTEHPVSTSGCLQCDDVEIGLGRVFAGARATVFRAGDDISVFIANRLIRRLTIDRTRRYQPTGNPRRPRRTPPSTSPKA